MQARRGVIVETRRPGWIPLYRKLLTSDVWRHPDKRFTALWIVILTEARWKDGEYRGIPVPRGSLLTTYGELTKAVNLPPRPEFFELTGLRTLYSKKHKLERSTTERWIDLLVLMEQIEKTAVAIPPSRRARRRREAGHFAGQSNLLLNVLNYEDYAVGEDEAGQFADSRRAGEVPLSETDPEKGPETEEVPAPGPAEIQELPLASLVSLPGRGAGSREGEEDPPLLSRRRYTDEELLSLDRLANVSQVLAFAVEYSVVRLPLRRDADVLPRRLLLPGDEGVRIGIAKALYRDYGGRRLVQIIRDYIDIWYGRPFERTRGDPYPSLANLRYAAPLVLEARRKLDEEGFLDEEGGDIIDPTGGLEWDDSRERFVEPEEKEG